MDLTQGSIVKSLLIYAWPVVLSSLLQSAYSITDLIVAGWFIGEGGISAINNASQVMQILTQIIMGITTGGNILMSQYYGSRDPVNREKTNRTLFFFSVTAGAVMTVAVLVLSRPILIGLRAPALEEATAYLTVCALGLIPIFGYNALSAMLRSVGNSRQPFYCVAVTAGVNIVLDCLFMGAFHWGVRGAALATVMAQTASFVVCLWYVRRHQDLFGLTRRRGGIERAKLTQMLKLGIPSAVQMTVVGLSWLAMTFLINDYGVDASAASGICAKIKDIALLSTLALYTGGHHGDRPVFGGGECFDRAAGWSTWPCDLIGVAAGLIVIIAGLCPPRSSPSSTPTQATMALAVQKPADRDPGTDLLRQLHGSTTPCPWGRATPCSPWPPACSTASWCGWCWR